MIHVLKLRMIADTKPQKFLLVLKDPATPQKAEIGTEGEVRTILRAVGISQPEIDKLFKNANSMSNPTSIT